MSEQPATRTRQLDGGAVDATLRRLLRAPEAPWLHGEIARRMAERLGIVRLQPEVVIDWWSHLGAGAELLAQAYPQAQRIAIEPNDDAAQRSRTAAQRPWWSARRWAGRTAQVELERDDLPHRAQLVWANMMLHAVVDPPALIDRWQRLLAVDGFVMFSCLGPGSLRELRELYREFGWPAPMAAFIDMHDLGDMLVNAGFADPVMDQETLTLQWDSGEALLAELRSLGANAAPDRIAGLRTPRWRGRLLQALESLRGHDGKLALSFEIAYGHAFKAAPRVRPGEDSVVSLEDMRAMLRSNDARS